MALEISHRRDAPERSLGRPAQSGWRVWCRPFRNAAARQRAIQGSDLKVDQCGGPGDTGANRSAGAALLSWIALAILSGSFLSAPAQAQEAVRQLAEEARNPIVMSIVVEGNQRFSDDQLISGLGQLLNEPLDEQAVAEGIDALWVSFHVAAQVSFRPVPGGIELLLTVEEVSADFEPRFIGNVNVSERKLYEWAGLERGVELYMNRVPHARERLVEQYRQHGYYFADVRVVSSNDQDGLPGVLPDVIFEIREGPVVRVEEVVIEGNQSMPDTGALFWKDGLRSLSKLETGTESYFTAWIPFYRPKFNPEDLAADLVAMRNVYRDQGWLDAVVELDRLEFNTARDRVTVVITIDEGLPYSVGSLDIEVVELVEDPRQPGRLIERPVEMILPREELLEACSLIPGKRYSRRARYADERKLRELYGERGYIAHRSLPRGERWEFLDPRLIYDVKKREVHVTYRIIQGQQHFIREILFDGTRYTQDRILRRELSIKPEDVADLLEIERSLSRIRRTGYFSNELDPFHPQPIYSFRDTPDPAWKDLVYTVEEGNVLRFDLRATAGSGFGFSGGVSLQMRNFDASNLPSSPNPWTVIKEIASRDAFHGAGQSFQIELFPGTEFSTYSISFREPDIFRRHLDRISLYVEASRRLRRGFRSHDEDRKKIGFEFGRQLDQDSSVYAGFYTGSVDVDDLDTGGEPGLATPLGVPELLAQQEGDSDFAWLEFGYRRSELDRLYAPRDGYRFSFSNSVYDSGLGSDHEFVQSEVSWDWHIPIGEDLGDPRPGLHTRWNVGVMFPYGDSERVPYTERFFLGGRNLRGFERRGVGPNQNSYPIGGETLLSGTLEYRFPLLSTVQPGTYEKREQFSAALFADAGITDPDDFSLDLSELRASVGFSFSLVAGLPLTLSFGFPIKEGDDDERETFRFDIGVF